MLYLSILKRFASRSTHHWLALKATENLDEPCKTALLYYVKDLLKGAKDPDDTLHDWYNHIFHPPSYGGALKRIKELYGELIEKLKKEDWKSATYLLGLISHYISDPMNPLHTGQTKEEAKIHKLYEFGTFKKNTIYDAEIKVEDLSFDMSELDKVLTTNWLKSHGEYFNVLENYDASKGYQFHWDKGINEKLDKINKELLGKSVSLILAIWKNALKEANVNCPKKSLKLKTLVAALKTPLFIIGRWLNNRYMKKVTKAMKKELKEKGEVYESLPPDDKGLVEEFKKLEEQGKLKMRREEGIKISKPIEPVKAIKYKEEKKEEPEKPKIEEKTGEPKQAGGKTRKLRYLKLDDPIEDAPEIGTKTGEKLRSIGIKKISDLLEKPTKEIIDAYPGRKPGEETVERWKTMTKMMTEIPNLRVKDVTYLYYAGIKNREDLEKITMNALKEKIERFLGTKKGEQIKNRHGEPDYERIKEIKTLLESEQ